MVGVSGKSKGCNTCRKRKIACDQQKPVCSQCIRSKRECGGYERDTVFVLVQPRAKKTHTFIKHSSAGSSFNPCATEDGRKKQGPFLVHATSSNMIESQETEDIRRHSENIGTCSAYVMLNGRIERYNIIQSFLSNCCPSSLPTSGPGSWMRLLGELSTSVEAFELSSVAVATSAIGHMFHDPSLIRQGLDYYTRGLFQLQRALNNTQTMQQDGTLAACMALSLCEAIDCPTAGSEGYFNHCHGFIALVQARGTRAHSAGVGHQLFLAIRVPSILYSLRSNSSTFLLDPIWMEEPWTETSKSLIHQVTDCLAEAPQILQRVSLLAHLDPTQQLQLIYELVQQAWKTDQKLKIIHDEVYHTTTDTMYCTVPSLINPLAERSNTSNLFPNSFHFANIEIGATLTLLWATRTILWSGLCNLYDFHDRVNAFMKMINTTEDSSSTPVSKNGNGSSDPLPPLGYCENYLDMAHNVCQSLQFFLQGDMGLVGIFSVSPAIGIVISSLQNRLGHDLEVSWLKAGLNLLREKSGAVSKI